MARKNSVWPPPSSSKKKKTIDFYNHVLKENPMFPFFIPLIVLSCWFLPLSNWVPLLFAVWATFQHGKFQRRNDEEELKQTWKQFILQLAPTTPKEPCEWLNKLLLDIWPNFLEPKISKKIALTVERRIKLRKPRWIASMKVVEFFLGSRPPIVGLHGTQWHTSGDKRILQTSFDWVTNNMNIMFSVIMEKPFAGTARIIVHEIKIKGTLLLMPILDGQALLYSFECTPELGVEVSFGSGGSQSMPANGLPGVSSFLTKLFTDTVNKQMVEPRRGCLTLPIEQKRKEPVGGLVSVTIVSAKRLIDRSADNNEIKDARDFMNFVEVEIKNLTRRTGTVSGSDLEWDQEFNMYMHGESDIIKLNLCEYATDSVKCDHLASCEIKMKYVPDGSTIFWAIGLNNSIIAKRSQFCGKSVEMNIPFEGNFKGDISVQLIPKEWHFSDELNDISQMTYQPSIGAYPPFHPSTGKRFKVSVKEGRNLTVKSGKCDSYVKLQYGKVVRKTHTITNDPNPKWNYSTEFDEIGSCEYLMLKCYSSESFGSEFIGSAMLVMDGGDPKDSNKDIWIPLEKVITGELRIQLEVTNVEQLERRSSGLIELVLIEARDLVAADIRGTSDPFVKVQYGNLKKKTKVIHKTLTPQWNQTLDFPDDGSQLHLFVKDHNAFLPTTSIGDCIVEYDWINSNQTVDKWIPLQNVSNGEIHIKITRKTLELKKKSKFDQLDDNVSSHSGISNATKICGKMRNQLKKVQDLVDDGDLDGLSTFLSEVESSEDIQEEYMVRLEKERALLLDKINNLHHEISKANTSSKMHKTFSS
ncbi:hypothetical protein ZOSMA_452G00060 [Zostera marina]|uniref:Plant synaptotagmin n=1 Tax=Zostera marina TaxID=29655 RepID=A0A0K9P0I9_ZOSMR|nr:hypothetical protein ZOSMA_452G00060 [Zostera marina]